MNKKALLACIFLLSFGVFYACKNSDKTSETSTSTSTQTTENKATAPAFMADSAYIFIEKQVAFGPRVPGSAASANCAKFLIKQFKTYGLEVTEQAFTATLYNGKKVASKNIIAAYNPKASKRILLAAHYDSRPFADKDPTNKTKAIDGANDGASGVGVLMELARVLSKDSLNLGIDFVLFDTEDWGAPQDYTGEVKHEFGGYCLGSEYWSKNLHKKGYSAYYGILLDMVGAPNALFRKDQLSMQVGSSIALNVWAVATSLGFEKYFSAEDGGGITDDHTPVNLYAKIPMIDIIDNRPSPNLFFEHHHTTKDDINTIDKNTLRAVGQTLLQVLYNEEKLM
jgi:glutaminyl-peptide cyclotransferase